MGIELKQNIKISFFLVAILLISFAFSLIGLFVLLILLGLAGAFVGILLVYAIFIIVNHVANKVIWDRKSFSIKDHFLQSSTLYLAAIFMFFYGRANDYGLTGVYLNVDFPLCLIAIFANASYLIYQNDSFKRKFLTKGNPSSRGNRLFQ